MRPVVRISFVALLLADFAAPASAAPATTPARRDDLASTFGKPYYDFCTFPSSVWCDWSRNRWYS